MLGDGCDCGEVEHECGRQPEAKAAFERRLDFDGPDGVKPGIEEGIVDPDLGPDDVLEYEPKFTLQGVPPLAAREGPQALAQAGSSSAHDDGGRGGGCRPQSAGMLLAGPAGRL